MAVHYLYIHIPFCLRKCLYCDFLSIPFDQYLSREYLNALLHEIEMKRDVLGVLKTIYIGGGTPTVLTVQELERLFQGLRIIPWSEDIEVTVEANPGTVSSEKIRTLRELGVNRISLGIQSFIDRELETLGRIHSSSDGIKAIGIVRDEGIKNLSIDLIYGIPGQSIRDWQFNLSRAMEFSPEHISTYELTPERETPLYDLLSEGRIKKPDDDEILSMYYMSMDSLTSNGYEHYEISNFAVGGFRCRHNLNYWDRGEYVGLGAGAHSFEGNMRRVNLRDVRRYIDTLKNGLIQYEEEIEIGPKDALKEYIFLGLRKRDGIPLSVIRYPLSFSQSTGHGSRVVVEVESKFLENLIRDGLLEMVGDSIRLTDKGITVSNSVIVKFFNALEV